MQYPSSSLYPGAYLYPMSPPSGGSSYPAPPGLVVENLLDNPSGRRIIGNITAFGGTIGQDAGSDTYVRASSAVASSNLGLTLETMTVGGSKLAPYATYIFSATIFGSDVPVQLEVAGTGATTVLSSVVTAGTFTRTSVVFATNATGSVTFYVINSATSSSSSVVAFRDAMVQPGSTLNAYGDGSMPGFMWLGTADQAPTVAWSDSAVIPQLVALGLGVGGALIDVSGYINGPEGVSFSYGRQSEFRDPNPAQAVFILDNYDGRFTPGNSASPYATPLSEGTQVSWLLGTRLFGAQVSAISFASSEDQWGRVTVTASDVFYIANRTPIAGLAGSIAEAQALNYWPLNDPAGSGQALEANGGATLYPDPVRTPALTFGVAANGAAAEPQLSMGGTNVVLGTSNMIGQGVGGGGGFAANAYPAGFAGAWGVWVTPSTLTDAFSLTVQFAISSTWTLDWNSSAAGAISLQRYNAPGAFTLRIPTAITPGRPYYLAFALTYSGSPSTMTATVYVNGVSIGSRSFASGSVDAAPTGLAITTTGLVKLSHLTHSPVLLHEEFAAPTTTANRLTALAQAVPGMNLGTVDANLSPATLDTMTSGSLAWAGFCDIIRTEQGHIYTATTGSLLAPTTTVNVRARTRPSAVTLTLDAAADIEGVPQFVRDITNLYATIVASGPTNKATATDAAAVARVGAVTTSETVTLLSSSDILGYAQDRLQRGENVALRLAQIDVNTTTSTVTAAQLLALNLGDRIRITNLPAGPLGFTQWDGWFLGASEIHNYQSDTFTLYLAPVLPRTALFDTDLFQAGGSLSLSAPLTSSATSMSVQSVDGTLLERVQVPYTLQVDAEQVTVTACTAPSGGVQTATITRGVNATAAAAHATGALVDVATPALFAF